MDCSELAVSGSEDEVRRPTAKHTDDDADSLSDSPELTCVGCKASSKGDCPIQLRKRSMAVTADEVGEAKKNKFPKIRVAWGKTTTRKAKTKTGRKVKAVRRCGQWCRVCMNILKKTLKRKKYKAIAKVGLKKGNQHAAVNKVKEELEDGSLTDRWKRSHAESVHQHAGGKSRVYSQGAYVKKRDKIDVELSQRGKFYLLSKYKELYADPSVTKAKVVKRRWKGKKVRGVVVVSDTDAGVFDHKTLSTSGTCKDRGQFDGAAALAEEDLDDAVSDAMSMMSEEISHPGSSGDHRFSLECAEGSRHELCNIRRKWRPQQAKPPPFPFISRGNLRGGFCK